MLVIQFIYLLILVLTILANSLLAWFAWRHQALLESRWLMVVWIAPALIGFSHLLVTLAPDSQSALFWSNMRFVGASLSPTFLLFAMRIVGFPRLNRWQVSALFIVPVVTTCIQIFAPIPNGFLNQWSITHVGMLNIEMLEYGAWWYVQMVYNTTVVTIASTLLVIWTHRLNPVFRRNTIAISAIAAALLIITVPTLVLPTLNLNLPNLFPLLLGLISPFAAIAFPRSRVFGNSSVAYAGVFKSLTNPILVLDRTDRVVEANPAAVSLFNLLENPSDPQSIRSINGFTQLAIDERELCLDANGVIRYFDIESVLLKDRTGAITGRLLSLHDITDRKRAESEREQLISTLENYANTVAHDLKNPIGITMGYIAIVKEELTYGTDRRPDLLELLEYALRGSQRSVRIIDEMLVFARLRDSKAIQLQPIKMTSVVRDALQMLSGQLDEAGVTLNQPDEFPIAMGHPVWIEEVWLNYLTNAIKYGGKPPVITLGADRMEGQVRYWVQDNGVGLAPADRDSLFAKYTRLDQHKHITGNGLGLAIAKEIVKRLGGTVGVESTLGEGSRFSFTLAAVPESPNERDDAATQPAPLQSSH
jgi:signal transduction histidine kinase